MSEDPFEAIGKETPVPPTQKSGRRFRKNVGIGPYAGDPELGATGPKKRRKPAALHDMTTKLLERDGYLVGRVERHNAFSGKKIDLFGIADMIAVGPTGIIFVQSCSATDRSKHMRTICMERQVESTTILCSGAEIVVVSWKREQQGKATRWAYCRESVHDGMLCKEPERFNGEWTRLAGDGK